MRAPVEAFDQQVRLAVHDGFLASGTAPTPESIAARVARPAAAVREAFERLAADHALVLDPATRAIRMAMPFSAVPTRFRVHAARGSWWANCAWDALGISAMLAGPAWVETTCGDCDAPLEVAADGRTITAGAGVVHFAVPARHWWDDIGFT